MKAKRRHELQENVLGIELGKLVDFLKRRGNHLAIAVLAVALIFLLIFYLRYSSRAKAQGIQVKWDRAVTAEMNSDERVKALTELTGQKDDPRLAALAGVQLGYEYARRLLAATDDAQRLAMTERASEWYQRTIQDFPREDLAVGKAHLGLARLAEGQRQLNYAADEYRKVLAMASLAGHPVAHLAEAGLRGLKALEAPVHLATTMPGSQAATARAAVTSGPAASLPSLMPASAPPPVRIPLATEPATRATTATGPAGD